MDLKERIEYLMKKKNIKNPKELSKESKVPYTTLRSILLDGVSDIRASTLFALADTLGASSDYLLGRTNFINPKEYIESSLKKLELTEDEYSFYIDNIIKTKSINIFADKDRDKEVYDVLLKVYFDYLHSGYSDNKEVQEIISKRDFTDEEIENLKNFNKPIDASFERLLKSLDKNKIVSKKNNGFATVFIYGTIPAGIAMEMIEDVIDTEEIPIEMLKGGKQYFGLLIKGDSMSPEYRDGDIIILEKVEDCESGNECVVMVNGNEGTFKKVIKNENGIILQPLNPKYQPMVYTNEQIEQLPVKIIGKVVQLRRNK